MARLIDPKVEARAVFTILDSHDSEVKMQLLALTSEDHFGYEPTREIYKTIRKGLDKSTKHRGNGGFRIPSSRALRDTPGLSEEARNILKEKRTPLNSKSDMEELYESLEFFRKIRSLHGTTKNLLGTLSKDPHSIDLGSVRSQVIQTVEDLQDPNEKRALINIHSDEGKELYKRVFKKKRLLASGFHNFDTKAGGHQRGDLVLLGANTGGGKSIMAMQLGISKYRKYNLNVAIATLELTEEQYLARVMSNISGIDHDHYRQIDLMTRKEKKLSDEKWSEFRHHGRRNRCNFEIIHPGAVSATDLLLMLKPHKFDVIIVDNVNDLEHESGGDSDWARLGYSAKLLKDGANDQKAIVYGCIHVTEDNRVAYSKMMKEKADNVWLWVYGDDEKASGTVKVNQIKARHFEAFSFFLTPEFKTQQFLDSAGPPVISDGEDKQLLDAMKEVP